MDDVEVDSPASRLTFQKQDAIGNLVDLQRELGAGPSMRAKQSKNAKRSRAFGSAPARIQLLGDRVLQDPISVVLDLPQRPPFEGHRALYLIRHEMSNRSEAARVRRGRHRLLYWAPIRHPKPKGLFRGPCKSLI